MRTTMLTVVALVLCLSLFGCQGQEAQKAAAPEVAPTPPTTVPGSQQAQPAAEAEKGVGGSSFHKNDITYSTEVATPHVEWAAKLPGGPVKGFFIPSIEFGRDMIELMERMPLEPTTVSIDRNWDTNCWGIGDYYGHEFRGDIDDFRIVFNYVEKDLTGPAKFEVMVIPGLNGWSRMTKATRDAILKRVEEGAGLVLIHPYVGDIKGHPFAAGPIEMSGSVSAAGDETPIDQREKEIDARIWDISPLVNCPDDFVSDRGYPVINKSALATGKWEVARQHYITAGLAMDLLPEGNIGGRFYKYEPAKDADVLVKSGDYPIIAVRNYGKGRVVALAYLEEGFIPEVTDKIFDARIYWNYWEYYYSLLGKCVLWAAGRDGNVTIDSLSAKADPALELSLALTSRTARTVMVTATGRSEFGPPLPALHATKKLAARKKGALNIAGEGAPAGGKGIYDVVITDAATGETLNWGSTTFEVTKKATLDDVKPSSDVYQRGETLSAVTRAVGALDGVSLRFSVRDDLDRLVYSATKTTRGEKFFSCSLDNFLGQYAFVTAELIDDKGIVIDQLKYKPILVVQDKRRPREYNALVSFEGGRPFFTSARTAVIHAAGASTGFTWGGAVDNGLRIPRGAFGVYWYDRGPTTPVAMDKAIASYEKTGDFGSLQYLTKKELYKRTGDKKFLVRVPSFNDPEYMKMLYNIVFGVARGKAIYNLDYYFVGDEGSLTSYGDAFDYDWSPYTLADFRVWLQGQYETLDALNAKWSTDYKNWDAVIPYTADEAKKSGSLAPWADHRTFMEITFANAYKTVRDGVVAGDPQGHIAVSGTQGTNAFNGCDWYRLDQVIDDFLAYGGGNQWDLHRSFAKPGAMIGFWTGYGSSGIGVQNAIWTAAVHNVLYPNIFWMCSYLNPDFTYSKSARDMGEAFKALKFEGVGKLFMEADRQQDKIAIHWSIASVHAAAITALGEGETGNQVVRSLQGSRDGWVTSIKDLGLQFDFVSYDQVENGFLDSGKYKVFILPSSVAISDKEAAAIQRFAENGGTVVADAGTGLMDDHCAWVDKGQLNGLFGISSAPSNKRTILGDPPRGGWHSHDSPGSATQRKAGIVGDVTVTDEGAKWGFTADNLKGLEGAEAGVTASGAAALAKVADADILFVNEVGKGRAIYLNSLLDVYGPARRMRFGGGNYRALVKGILAESGVKPAIEITTPDGGPLSQAVLVRYQFGTSDVLAVVKEAVRAEGVTGMDGVTTYNDANLGQIAKQEITIHLPQQYYVTDVRTGERFGKTDVVKTSIIVGGPLVLGLSPEENALSVVGPEKATLGEHPAFTITRKPAGKCLVRCHFTAPDGKFLNEYASNVVFDGESGQVILPSAMNDAPGKYTLKATDVVTGATAEAAITLE